MNKKLSKRLVDKIISKRATRLISKRAAEYADQFGNTLESPEQMPLEFGIGGRHDWNLKLEQAKNEPGKYITHGWHHYTQFDSITFPMLQNMVENDLAQYNKLLHGSNFDEPKFHIYNYRAMENMIEDDPNNFFRNEWWRYEKIVPKGDALTKLIHDGMESVLEEDVGSYYRIREENHYSVVPFDDLDSRAYDFVSDLTPIEYFDGQFDSGEDFEDLTRDNSFSLAKYHAGDAWNMVDDHPSIIHYAGDTLAMTLAEEHPVEFFSDMYEDKEALLRDYGFEIPEEAIKIAGEWVAEHDPDAFRELELYDVPELGETTAMLEMSGTFAPKELAERYKLEPNIKEDNFYVVTTSDYQDQQRHPETKDLKRYDFSLNTSTDDQELRRQYKNVVETYSDEFHDDIGLGGSNTKSFALISLDDDKLYVEEIQSDWPGVLYSMKVKHEDARVKSMSEEERATDDFARFIKSVSEHSVAFQYLMVQRLAEFAAINNIRSIRISSLAAIETMTGSIRDVNKKIKSKFTRTYKTMPSELGFEPDMDKPSIKMLINQEESEVDADEIEYFKDKYNWLPVNYFLDKIFHRPGTEKLTALMAQKLGEDDPRTYMLEGLFLFREFDNITKKVESKLDKETLEMINRKFKEELGGRPDALWNKFEGSPEEMKDLAKRAEEKAKEVIGKLHQPVSKRDTHKNPRRLDLSKLKPAVKEILGDRTSEVEFSEDIRVLMQSLNKLQKAKRINNKEKNKIRGMINKFVVAFLNNLIVKVAEPNDMIKYISKRAKVKSDKPAYKEKKKTDKGYVWLYDEKHVEKRWKEKKDKMKSLEKNLKKVRSKYQADLTAEDDKTRAIAAIVGIMDDTAMRIGNEDSAKEGTFGATTLKVKHVKGGSGNMTFDFPGKGAIEQNVVLKNNKVIKVIRDLMKGKKANDFIFEIDGKKIWDRAVNRYLKEFGISAKDLRGFHANRLMKEQLKSKSFTDALEEVAEIVGHEPSTLKNQYLDPELVEKHEGKEKAEKEKGKDKSKKDKKKKKAAISCRAYGETTDPMPNIPDSEEGFAPTDQPMSDPTDFQNMEKMVDVNLNVNNAKDAVVFQDPSVQNAWRTIAPFLPPGSMITSAFRDDFEQAKFFVQKWRSWANGWNPRQGFFAKEHPEYDGFVNYIENKIEKETQFTQRDYARFAKMNKIMREMAEDIEGYKEFAVAVPGTSYHAQDAAFDISGASLRKISGAVNFVAEAFPQHLQLRREPFIEPEPQSAVHVELSRAAGVPDMGQYVPVLYKYLEQEGRLTYGQQITRQETFSPPISKRAELSAEDAQWVDGLKGLPGRMQPGNLIDVPQQIRKSWRIRSKAKLNPLLFDAWRTLQPFLPAGAEMTSGFRTAEDQKRILNYYWKKATGNPVPQHLRSDMRTWRQVSALLGRHHGYIVGPPTTKRRYAHLNGNALDISGADLHEMAAIVKAVSDHPGLHVSFRKPFVEQGNNCIHVGVESARFDEEAIVKVLKETGHRTAALSVRDDEQRIAKQAEDIYGDMLRSNPPKEILDKLVTAFDDDMSFADDEEGLADSEDEFTIEMGFGKEDAIGDWFEKAPMFRWREDIPEFEIHDVNEAEAKKLAEDDPEKFFYRGLHKDYTDLEAVALEKMIEDNAKFFFIFLYHEREGEEFQKLVEPAAEALSLQDARAFFYYHLHHKFPELGRGAIIQLIDTNPDSFFDLGLQKDYPDLEESAGAARNIKDPNKVELEQPEWLKHDIENPISLRDRNASDERITEEVPEQELAVKELPEGYYWKVENVMAGKMPENDEAALQIKPDIFLKSPELMKAFPYLALAQANRLSMQGPTNYFLFKYHKRPELKEANQDALLRLLDDRPAFYFHSGLFLDEEFSHAIDTAALNILNSSPQIILDLAQSSPVIKDAIQQFIPDAEQIVKETTGEQERAREEKARVEKNYQLADERKRFWKHQFDIKEIGEPPSFWEYPKAHISQRVKTAEAPKIGLTPEEKQVFDTLKDAIGQFKLNTTVRVAGGWVRDKLMGLPSKDIDIAVDNMTGKEFAEHIGKYARSRGIDATAGVIPAKPEQGKHLETAIIHMFGESIDVVNLRDEEYDEESRKPVVTITDSPLKDAFRRDLTINALFYNIHTDEVEDFTGQGIEDIENKVLRTPKTVTEDQQREVGRFIDAKQIYLDDPLRVMRAIRFANRYPGFKLDPEIVTAARDQEVQEAFRTKITWERRQDELSKIMSENKSPREALELIKDLGYRSEILQLPDQYSEWELDQNNPHHEFTVWGHLMEALDNIYEITKNEDLDKADRYILNWATLLHDVGKLDPSIQGVKEQGDQLISTYHGHENSSIQAAQHILGQLKGTKNKDIKRIQSLIDSARRVDLDPNKATSIKAKTINKILELTRDFDNDWKRALQVALADAAAHKGGWLPEFPREGYDHLSNQFEKVPSQTALVPIISGMDLQNLFGRKPGKWIGQINRELQIWQTQAATQGLTLSKEDAVHFVQSFDAQNTYDDKGREYSDPVVPMVKEAKLLSSRAGDDDIFSLYEDLNASDLISPEELVKIYELYYKIGELERSQSPFAMRRIEKMTADLSILLSKGLGSLKEVYKWWVNVHYNAFDETKASADAMTEEINKNYPDLADDLLKDLSDWDVGFRTKSDRALNDISNELKEKLFKQEAGPFENIMKVYGELQRGASGDINSDSALFNHALNVVHQGGPMVTHLAEVTGISEQLLTDLSDGKFIEQWDRDIGKKVAAVSYLSGIPDDIRAELMRLPGAFQKEEQALVSGQMDISPTVAVLWSYFDRTYVNISGQRTHGYGAVARLKYSTSGAAGLAQYISVLSSDSKDPQETLKELSAFLMDQDLHNKMTQHVADKEKEEEEQLAEVIPLFGNKLSSRHSIC